MVGCTVAIATAPESQEMFVVSETVKHMPSIPRQLTTRFSDKAEKPPKA